MTILFVCTGNTCRSPMAEYMLKALRPELEVFSRGLSVYENSGISENARLVLEEKGLSAADFLSCRISEEDVRKADIILAVSKNHNAVLTNNFSQYKEKISTIYRYALGEDFDIADPYGGSLEEYRKCADEIEKAVKQIAEMI